MATSLETAAAAETAVRPSWRQRLAPFVRPVLAFELASSELVVFSLLVKAAERGGLGLPASGWIRPLQAFVVVTALVWVIALWPRRRDLASLWAEAGAGRRWWPWIAVNIVAFGVLVHATVHVAVTVATPGGGFPLGMAALAGTSALIIVGTIVGLAAPIGLWRRAVLRMPTEALLGPSVGLVAAALV